MIITPLLLQSIMGQNTMCASEELHNQMMYQNPMYNSDYLEAQKIMAKSTKIKRVLENKTYYIPVVVHIIHTGHIIGFNTNPSDAQIQNYIDRLNKGFSATFPGYPDTLQGGQNINIQFVLAKSDTLCKPTNGIVRINAQSDSVYANYGVRVNDYPLGLTYLDIAKKSFWNSKNYINIYVINLINGGKYAGFAFYPTTTPFFGEGVYLDNDDIYTNTPYISAHELGHYFDLAHTFQGSNGSICPPNADCFQDGDKICDTEPTIEVIKCSATAINPCTGKAFGKNTVNNYMNYHCNHTLFTADQKQRMKRALLYLRTSLITSTGGQTPNPTLTTIVINSKNNTCQGQPVIYSAIVLNGNKPVYNWKVNSTKVGNNDSTFTYIPSHLDTVMCQLTSLDACIKPNPAKSNKIIMKVIEPISPNVSYKQGEDSKCEGEVIELESKWNQESGNLPSTKYWIINGQKVSQIDSVIFNLRSGENYVSFSAVFQQIPQCYLSKEINFFTDTIFAYKKPEKPIILTTTSELVTNYMDGQVQWFEQNLGPKNGETKQKFSPKEEGHYYCVAKINSCISVPSDTIHFIHTSIYDNSVEKLLKIYPNPSFLGIYNIDWPIEIKQGSISIYNIDGILLNVSPISNNINLSNYSRGVYIIKVTSSKSNFVRKLIFE